MPEAAPYNVRYPNGHKPKATVVMRILIGKSICFLICGLLLLQASPQAFAQQINVTTPINSVGSSFFETFGTSFGFSLPGGSGSGSRVVGLLPNGQLTPNVTFSQNGFGSAIPPFGGYYPNSGATFGLVNFSRDGGGFSLGFNLAQGSNRSSISSSPSLTLTNGGIGSFSNGAFNPFVTAVTPVVPRDNAVTRGIASGQLQPFNPKRVSREYDSSVSTTDNRVSSATVGAPSLAEIRQRKEQQAQAANATVQSFIEAAEQAVESENLPAARSQILKALRHTQDKQQKRQLKAWLKSLRKSNGDR